MAKEGEVLNDLSDDEVKVEEVAVVKEEEEKPEVTEESKPKGKKGKKKEDKAVKEVKEDVKPDIEASKEEEEEDKDVEVPPPKPTRPLTPRQEAHKNLKDAFPAIEEKVITTVLIASNYNLEQAFNSLLYYADPDSVNVEDLLLAQQPTQAELPDRPSQYEQDELLAKQLDEEFNKKERRRAERRRRQSEQGNENTYLEEDADVFTNFVEKDLPQIKEQVSKNFEETKNKFNTWIGGWKKNYQEQQQAFQQSRQQQQQQARRQPLRTNNQFDDEPEEVDLQKIHGISLNDNTSKSNKDEELYSSSKSKKWEPLKGTKPEPISNEGSTAAADHGVVDDDFLLSDDEDVKK